MNKIILFITLLLLFSSYTLSAQNLPDEMHFSLDGRRLITGGLPYTGFYHSYIIQSINLEFDDPDFWDELKDKYNDGDKENIPGSITVDGLQFDSVGIRFKGSTSYTSANDDKKSFNISMDEYIPDQELYGYKSLNLHNAMGDPSFMAEILYEYQIHKHVPAPKGNFVHLFINGQDWGIYANVQQLNRDFSKEWFLKNDGAMWRAKRPPGSPAPNGTQGDSSRSLHYLGSDTTAYVNNYYLKNSRITDPHTQMMNMTLMMDTVSNANMESVLGDYLDIDGALWFLASENAFADDDSYVVEGRSDYYIYLDGNGRIVPLEFDANGCMNMDETEQDIFLNANKPNYSLLYRLLNNPALRQRYLAHYRTLVNDAMDTVSLFQRIDDFYSMINPIVQNDPVSNYTYAEFENHQDELKDFIRDRKEYIEDDSEYDVESPSISNTTYFNGTTAWFRPEANQAVTVVSTAFATAGIQKVTLYYAEGLRGKFIKAPMFDDGLHNDQLSGDGKYGSTIPGHPGGTWIRFYVEATSNNSDHTVSYDPPGAEHDIYTFLVEPSLAIDTSVVINEFMADNFSTVTDSSGEYADWIELYNNSTVSKNVGGFYLTDDTLNLIKWLIPAGTVIPPNGYLILWADDQESEGSYHTNFKMNQNGEQLLLLNSNGELVDEVKYGLQTQDLAYARLPNGTGDFVFQSPTFSHNNNPSVGIENLADRIFNVFPNPANNYFIIDSKFEKHEMIYIMNSLGEIIYKSIIENKIVLNTELWPAGVYFLRVGNTVQPITVQH